MNLNQFLQQFGENQVAGFLLVLGRIGPLFALAPLFSSRSIPPRAKSVLAVALTVGIAPIALAGHAVPLEVGQFVELMLKEILVGLAYAFALAALFAAVSTAGSFLDTLIGFSYGALVDPVTGNQSAVLTQAYTLVGILVLIAIGGDQLIIKGVARSYDLVPLLAMPSLPALVGGAQAAFVQVFLSALELAAPVVLAIVITDAAFGDRLARRPAAQRLRRRLPREGHRRRADHRRLAAVHGRLDGRRAAALGRHRPPIDPDGLSGQQRRGQDREGDTQEARRGAAQGPGRQEPGPRRRRRAARLAAGAQLLRPGGLGSHARRDAALPVDDRDARRRRPRRHRQDPRRDDARRRAGRRADRPRVRDRRHASRACCRSAGSPARRR